jgi:hypothetical protein
VWKTCGLPREISFLWIISIEKLVESLKGQSFVIQALLDVEREL